MTWITRISGTLFGIYAWIVFSACILVGLGAAVFVPGADRRARWLARITRGIFVLSGTPVDVRGSENLPAADCIVVANHASYVDGFLLKAYLPSRFSFVIKGEMRNIPIVHFLLRRAGSRFVERGESAASARDARRIVRAAKNGHSLAIFPEGTFQLEPGLMRLRAGAFVAAVHGRLPVVPVVISGTRHILPADRHLPRFGRIQVDILPAIGPGDESFAHHRELAKTVRKRILAVLDEPDLVGSEATTE